MRESTSGAERHEPIVYGVRPEPPHFEELVRRPDPVEPYSFAVHPPGRVRRSVGAQRARLLFRVGLAVALAAVVAAFMR